MAQHAITTRELEIKHLAPAFNLEHLKKRTGELDGYQVDPKVYEVFPEKLVNGGLGFKLHSKGNASKPQLLQGYYKFVVTMNYKGELKYYADLEQSAQNGLQSIISRPDNKPYAQNHSDLVHGQPVVFSGYANFGCSGQLSYLTNESGHYKLLLAEAEKFTLFLAQQFNLQEIALHDYSQEPGSAYYIITVANDAYIAESVVPEKAQMVSALSTLGSDTSNAYAVTRFSDIVKNAAQENTPVRSITPSFKIDSANAYAVTAIETIQVPQSSMEGFKGQRCPLKNVTRFSGRSMHSLRTSAKLCNAEKEDTMRHKTNSQTFFSHSSGMTCNQSTTDNISNTNAPMALSAF